MVGSLEPIFHSFWSVQGAEKYTRSSVFESKYQILEICTGFYRAEYSSTISGPRAKIILACSMNGHHARGFGLRTYLYQTQPHIWIGPHHTYSPFALVHACDK